MRKLFLALLAVASSLSARQSIPCDLVLRNGVIYNGLGTPPVRGDVYIRGDSILAIGAWKNITPSRELDLGGLAVAPGFINMLSHSEESLIEDPRSLGELMQGVTLEVLGESSMGPVNDTMKKEAEALQGDIKYPITWKTLGQYLDFLEQRGISTNVASFVGAGTVRQYVLGLGNRAPNPDELEAMKGQVRQAMEEGAMGLTCALIYTPDVFMKTDELVALAKVASSYGGMYTSHIRSEGNRLLQAADELIAIAKEAQIPAEFFHLKAAGKSNWPKLDALIAKVDSARASGLRITADMYTYTAAATGFDAAMPPWVQEGGYGQWAERLRNKAIRDSVKKEMTVPTDRWENLYLAAGAPENVLVVGFRNPALKPQTGKTLAQVAAMRGTSPEETIMDLVVEDSSRVSVVYFLMSEENVRKQIALPWMSFCSDEASQAPEGNFLKSNPHPRAYGNFIRLLAKYVRDEHVVTLEEAVRRLTSLPASNLKLRRRGNLLSGSFADIVVFDPAKVQDHATYDQPHQLATGVVHVFVNGVQVISNGVHTGAKPGRIVRGPGWKPNSR